MGGVPVSISKGGRGRKGKKVRKHSVCKKKGLRGGRVREILPPVWEIKKKHAVQVEKKGSPPQTFGLGEGEDGC